MSCFSTNNPITLYNHFITISAGSEHLTSFLYQTSLSTPEKVYQSTQINLKKLTNLIFLIKLSSPPLHASPFRVRQDILHE